MSQCTATSKRTHERCQRPSIKGRTTCYHHGGSSPSGIASATLKDGRYSKSIPANLLATYQQSKNDPNLLAMDEEVALATSKIDNLLAGIGSGESSATIKGIYDSWQAFKAANRRKDADAAKVAADEHDQLIARAFAIAKSWDEILRWMDAKRKASESELKRRVAMHQMVTADQVALLVRSLTGVVREHVTDPDALRAISDALSAIAVASTD